MVAAGGAEQVMTKKCVISSSGHRLNLAIESCTLSFMKGSEAPYEAPAESRTTVFRGGPATKRLTIEQRRSGSTSSAGPTYV